jgi:carbon monoxide dehydrogenase subunit G
MKLTHDFLVRLPVEAAWTVLTDLERIAPCMPGVHLDSVAGDEFGGRLKVKVGPITADYAGIARFVERDVEAWTVVWRAEGRETRGKGSAAATVTMELSPEEAGTRVEVRTDLAISGRLAQFGRGVLGEVSNRLLAQFVTALEREVAGDRQPAVVSTNGRAPAAPVVTRPAGPAANLAALDWPDDEAMSATSHSVRSATKLVSPEMSTAADNASLDVLAAVAVPVGKRLLVAGVVVTGVVLLARLLRR